MSGMKGRSGTNKDKHKPWVEALRIAVMREDGPNKRRRLQAIADKCAEMALQGDMQAIKEIGDRLDGKPAQEQHVTIDDKRDATDWTRDELVAFLNDARAGGNGTIASNGRGDGPDSIH